MNVSPIDAFNIGPVLDVLQVGSAEIDPRQVGMDKLRTAEINRFKVGSGQVPEEQFCLA